MSDPIPTIPEGGAEQKKTIWKQLNEHIGKYGWIALIFAAFAAWQGFTIWNAGQFISRADQQTQQAFKQADMNEKIGILEGQMQILLQEKQQTCISSTPTPAH